MINKWKCSNCGYRFEAKEPPTTCPSCQQKCAFIDDNCYTPECGLVEDPVEEEEK